MMRAPRLTPLYIAVCAAFGNLPQAMADEEKTLTLSPVVVTATRQAQNSFDLPVAIDVVEQKNIKDGQLQMNLSESLIRVPGITAQNRTQQAQDPQISSRGFGSRSASACMWTASRSPCQMAKANRALSICHRLKA